MRLLLDTHAVIWWFDDDPALSVAVKSAIADLHNEIFVSPVSAYEMTLKHKLGRLPNVARLLDNLQGYIDGQGFRILPIDLSHAETAGRLPLTHRDPFDRLLIAQAQIEEATLVSNETLFDDFGVRRLW